MKQYFQLLILLCTLNMSRMSTSLWVNKVPFIADTILAIYVLVKLPLISMSFIIEDGCSRSLLILAYQGLMNLRMGLLELPSTSSILKTQWCSWQYEPHNRLINQQTEQLSINWVLRNYYRHSDCRFTSVRLFDPI